MNAIRYFFSPKVLASAIVAAAIGVVGFLAVDQSPVSAACNPNDVVPCGYSTPTDLANKMNSSLSTLYNHDFTPGYGIGDLNYWKANAQGATFYKDGRVVLDDGTQYGTNASSLGRKPITGNIHKLVLPDGTYWYGPNTGNFASNSLRGHVLLNADDHSLQFAALTACGNPVWFDSPAYKCKMLSKEKVNHNTYKFTTQVHNKNATLTKLVYEFGDGKKKEITSNFAQAVTHTYDTPGDYTAKVTAYFSVGGKEKSDTREKCTTPVKVEKQEKPVFTCEFLQFTKIDRLRYSFTAKGDSHLAKFESGKIDFGDGSTANNLTEVQPGSETVTTTHDYAKAGTYTIKAFLTYDKGTTKETPDCVKEIKITEETCVENKDLPGCQVLPSTGPTEMLISALGLSSITGAGLYYIGTRRNLVSTLLNR